MHTLESTMARHIAEAASASQQQRTGLAPQSATVVLVEDTLVVTLYGALSPAEKTLAQSTLGAAQVQEFHRQLFATSSAPLREEIERIIDVEALNAAGETESITEAVIHAFASGTMVQVFHLAKKLPVSFAAIPLPSPIP